MFSTRSRRFQPRFAPLCAVLVSAALWSSALAAWLTVSEAHAAPSSAPKLNVVFILADDLGWAEIGAYGQKKIPTPNLDRLATQGMRFTQHYSGAPVCAPARCVLLTGKHLGHAEIRGNQQARVRFPEFSEGQHPLSAQARTLAQVFREHGYATAAFGKWGLGPVGSTGDPNAKGFDLFFGYNCQSQAHSYYPPHLWRNREKIPINPNPIPGHSKQSNGPVIIEKWIGQTYAPSRTLDEAVAFLKGSQHQPFFLYLPFIQPHVALHPPQAAVEKFPTDWDPTPYRGENGYLPHPRPRAAYAALISELDASVGRVLDTLDQLQLAQKTLVIFTSDNGSTHPGQPGTQFHIGGADPVFFKSTAHLRGFKGSLYEGGIRVPLIARLPGVIPTNSISTAPTWFADWFPTLCDAASLPAPENPDGQSFWPTLTGAAAPPHRKPMLWVFPEYGGQVAVRLGDFKIIRQDLKTATPKPWEVYNLASDPSESQNLASQRSDLIEKARALLEQETSPNEIFPVPLPK